MTTADEAILARGSGDAESSSMVAPRPQRCGTGVAEFSLVGGRSVVTRAAATSPLRLLTPQSAGTGGWLITSSFGGGLLAGDELALSIDVNAGATAYVGSQSSTKVYRCPPERSSSQQVTGRVREGAFLALLPDPVVCYAQARYMQRQRIEMAGNSGLVLLDWFTSGRHCRGERWAATQQFSNEIWIDGTCVLRDRLRLEAGARKLGMEAFNCLATVVILGASLQAHAQALLEWARQVPIVPDDRTPIGISPLAGGVILRVAGANVEQVARVVFERLAFVGQLLGECPWHRKW